MIVQAWPLAEEGIKDMICSVLYNDRQLLILRTWVGMKNDENKKWSENWGNSFLLRCGAGDPASTRRK